MINNSIPDGQSAVLITGGSGFIGSAMVRRLARTTDAQIHVIVREHSNLDRISEEIERINLHRFSLDEPDALLKRFTDIPVDYIFNFAEPSHHNLKSPAQFSTEIQKSTRIMTNILGFSKETGVKKVVHACSSTIYGSKHHKSAKESDHLQPDTLRGIIKLAEYNLCQYYARHYNVPVQIGRIFRAYGPYDHQDRLVNKILNHFLKNELLTLVNTNSQRDYIHLDDLIDGFLKICYTELPYGSVFNLGGGRLYTAMDIVETVENILEMPHNLSKSAYPSSKIDATIRLADITKARKSLGWKPRIDLTEGLANTINWFKNTH